MKNFRLQDTQIRDLIKALLPYPKGRHRRGVLDDVRRAKQARAEDIGKNFDESFQSAFNSHNKDSRVWSKLGANPRDALFYFPGPPRRQGWWAVNPERAKEWLAEHPSSGDIQWGEGPADF